MNFFDENIQFKEANNRWTSTQTPEVHNTAVNILSRLSVVDRGNGNGQLFRRIWQVTYDNWQEASTSIRL